MAPRLRGILLAVFLVLLTGYLGLSPHSGPYFQSSTAHMESDSCPFCAIATSYLPSKNSSVPEDPNPELISPSCYLILNTELVMAFLDIMPITAGHILVVSRPHREKLSDLRGSESAAIGAWLPIISRAVMKALGRPDGDWNVVQNNGATAAQMVFHVHYHIIPRSSEVLEVKAKSWTMFGRGQRDELDDEDAMRLSARIRQEIKSDLEKMDKQDPEGLKMLGKL